MAIPVGCAPTGMGGPALLAAVEMGVTVFEALSATYTVAPFGVIATLSGFFPTGILVPGVLVAVEMGVTVFEKKLLTYAVVPFGVMAMPKGIPPP